MDTKLKQTEANSQQTQTVPAAGSQDSIRREQIETVLRDINGMKNTFLTPSVGRSNLLVYCDMLRAYVQGESFPFHDVRGDAEGLINEFRQSCRAPSHADRHNELTERRRMEIQIGQQLTDRLCVLIRSVH